VAVGLISDTATDGQASLKMDKDGNINVEGKTKISLKVGETTIVITEDGININGKTFINVISNGTLALSSTGSTGYHSDATLDITSNGTMTITGSNEVDIN